MISALSEEFVNVGNAKDIQPSQMKAVEVNGEKVCLVNVEGKYYAIGDVCTHLGGPLANGRLEGYEVQCPWHGSRFDIRTGIVAMPPAARSEPTYQIKLENDNVLVKSRAKSNQS